MNDEVPCKDHPDAPHGFCRDASHSYDRYVCECEFWEPEENKIYTQEEVDKIVADTIEACAKVCDEIATKEWDAYKGRTEPIDRDKLYNPHIEGISDGADECAAAIRARDENAG